MFSFAYRDNYGMQFWSPREASRHALNGEASCHALNREASRHALNREASCHALNKSIILVKAKNPGFQIHLIHITSDITSFEAVRFLVGHNCSPCSSVRMICLHPSFGTLWIIYALDKPKTIEMNQCGWHGVRYASSHYISWKRVCIILFGPNRGVHTSSLYEIPSFFFSMQSGLRRVALPNHMQFDTSW